MVESIYKNSEKYLERHHRNAVSKAGYLCLKLIPVNYNGFPDRTCFLRRNRTVFVEFKTKGFNRNSPTFKRQMLVRKALEDLGYTYYLIDSYEALQEFIMLEL